MFSPHFVTQTHGWDETSASVACQREILSSWGQGMVVVWV